MKAKNKTELSINEAVIIGFTLPVFGFIGGFLFGVIGAGIGGAFGGLIAHLIINSLRKNQTKKR